MKGAGMEKRYVPLRCDTHDATHNAMQRDINTAAQHILAALDEPRECPDCGDIAPWPEWMHRLKITRAGDIHEQRSRGSRFDGLSSSTYSLAFSRLVDLGLLEHGPGKWDYTVRRVR